MTKNNQIRSVLTGIIAALFIVLTASVSMGVTTYAANEDIDSIDYTPQQNYTGVLMTLSTNADAMTSKDADATVARAYNAGEVVLLVEEDDDWYTIYYDNTLLYISKAAKNGTEVLAPLDTSALDTEMDKQAQIDKAWIESFSSQLKAVRNAKIWRTAIIVVIVLLVVFIVYKGVKGSGNKEKKEKK